MSLFRGPFEIKVNGRSLPNVISLEYYKKDLVISYYSDNNDIDNFILDDQIAKVVKVYSCTNCKEEKNARVLKFSSNKNTSSSLYLPLSGPMVIKLKIEVSSAKMYDVENCSPRLVFV